MRFKSFLRATVMITAYICVLLVLCPSANSAPTPTTALPSSSSIISGLFAENDTSGSIQPFRFYTFEVRDRNIPARLTFIKKHFDVPVEFEMSLMTFSKMKWPVLSNARDDSYEEDEEVSSNESMDDIDIEEMDERILKPSMDETSEDENSDVADSSEKLLDLEFEDKLASDLLTWGLCMKDVVDMKSIRVQKEGKTMINASEYFSNVVNCSITRTFRRLFANYTERDGLGWFLQSDTNKLDLPLPPMDQPISTTTTQLPIPATTAAAVMINEEVEQPQLEVPPTTLEMGYGTVGGDEPENIGDGQPIFISIFEKADDVDKEEEPAQIQVGGCALFGFFIFCILISACLGACHGWQDSQKDSASQGLTGRFIVKQVGPLNMSDNKQLKNSGGA